MTTAQQLVKEAESIEKHAKDQLTVWTILGQTGKYAAAMEQAAKLRRAADLPSARRNEFMRSEGIK